MDENKLPDQLSDDKWLEEFLAAPDLGAEIGVDEQAIAAAGLTHPSDLELEKIMQEVLSEVQAEEAAQKPSPAPAAPQPQAESAPPAEPETFKDDEFRATFGEGESLNQIFSDQPIAPAPK